MLDLIGHLFKIVFSTNFLFGLIVGVLFTIPIKKFVSWLYWKIRGWL